MNTSFCANSLRVQNKAPIDVGHQQLDKSSFPELFLLFKDEKPKKMKSTRSFFNPDPLSFKSQKGPKSRYKLPYKLGKKRPKELIKDTRR
jgi:hypothetical protein